MIKQLSLTLICAFFILCSVQAQEEAASNIERTFYFEAGFGGVSPIKFTRILNYNAGFGMSFNKIGIGLNYGGVMTVDPGWSFIGYGADLKYHISDKLQVGYIIGKVLDESVSYPQPINEWVSIQYSNNSNLFHKAYARYHVYKGFYVGAIGIGAFDMEFDYITYLENFEREISRTLYVDDFFDVQFVVSYYYSMPLGSKKKKRVDTRWF